MSILIIIIIIAALVGISALVSRAEQKPPSEPAARDVEWRISTAKSRAIEAEARLAEWRVVVNKVEAQVRDDAKTGMIRRIWKSIRENPKLWVSSGSYVWFSLFGALYTRSYYQQFNINIFDFAEPLDFLLIAFADKISLSIALITLIIVVVLTLLLIWVIDRIRKQDKPTLQRPDKPEPYSIAHLLYLVKLLLAPLLYLVKLLRYTLQCIRDGLIVFSATVLLLTAIFLLPPSLGNWQSRKMLKEPQYVRVMLRQDPMRLETILSPCALWVGVTQNSLFLLEEKQENKTSCRGSKKQEVSLIESFSRYLGELATFVISFMQYAPGVESFSRYLGEVSPHFASLLDLPNIETSDNRRLFILPQANIASLEFNPPSSPVKEPRGFCREFKPITHFPESEHDELESPGKEILTILFNEMTPHFKNYRPDRLILAGRVDINKFKSKEKREFYGTQITLARARAEWVHGELLKRFSTQIDSQQVTLRTAGPRCTDPNSSKCDQALDRSVEVYACWTPREPNPTSASAEPTQ